MLGWPLPGIFTDHTHSMTLALTELVLLIPIVYVNDAYFINGFKSLAHGAPTMDALIAVGATARSPGRSMPCLSWPTSWPPGKSTRP